MSDLRYALKRALDDNFPAYDVCVGTHPECPHHAWWEQELDEIVDAVLARLNVEEEMHDDEES